VADPDADTIALTLPAEDAMLPVVEVAIGVLARRWGLSDDEVASARAAASDAFDDVSRGGGPEPVDIEVRAAPQHLDVRIRRGGTERRFHAPLA
jgi:hypothetical protein